MLAVIVVLVESIESISSLFGAISKESGVTVIRIGVASSGINEFKVIVPSVGSTTPQSDIVVTFSAPTNLKANIFLFEEPGMATSLKKFSTPFTLKAVDCIHESVAPPGTKNEPGYTKLKLLDIVVRGVIFLKRKGRTDELRIAGSEESIALNKAECLNTPSNLFKSFNNHQ